MNNPLRVVVESRHELTRVGLTRLIENNPDRAQVVSADDGAGRTGHNVTVYDLSDRQAAAEVDLRRLISTRTKVVVLRQGSCSDIAQGILAMGAAGVVSMDVSADELLHSIEQAATGRRVVPVPLREQGHQVVRLATGLTERELDVLELIATGLSNDEIAAELYVSINTVKSYIRTAYKRIGVDTRSHAVIWALRNGIGPRLRVRVPEPPNDPVAVG